MTLFTTARWRLTLWFALVVAVILAIIGVAVYGTARAAIFSGVNDDLRTRAAPLLAARRAGLETDPIGRGFTAGGYSYAAVHPDGTIARTSGNVDPDSLPPPDEVTKAVAEGPKFVDTTSSDGEHLRFYMVNVQRPRTTDVVLEVGRSTEPEHRALGRLLLILGAGGAAGLLLAVGGGFVLAGRALQPIKTAMDKQQKFVADASHELRTPLTLIRANAEILKREAQKPVHANLTSVDDIIQETDRLSGLVGQMLTLAKADAGQEMPPFVTVDLSVLASDAAREMRLLADEKRISINAGSNGAVSVRGDPTRLRELVTILLDNSIKYSDPGASVHVSVHPLPGKASLQVTDTGRGIPKEALPNIFERFYRADKARSRQMGGAGLGLAIARWIVEVHGGTIGIRSEAGRGTTVTVDLPLAGGAS